MSPHGQSILMRKCVAEQILENWLKSFLTYLEIYSLDADANLKAELNELKQIYITDFKGSREKQLVELKDCWTLMMKFEIIGKTTTPNEKTVYGNILL